MIRNLLLAVDGSETANRATDTAAELAHKLGAGLSIVHVLMHGRPTEELVRMAEVEHLVEQARVAALPKANYAPRTYLELLKVTKDNTRDARVITAVGDQIMARAVARCAELGVEVATRSIRHGDYADEILDAATACAADVVVIGTRGLGRVRSTVLGSVSQKILNHASCNVLTVV